MQKWTWLISYYCYRYLVFVAVFGPIFVIISFILAGTEVTETSNSVTLEMSLSILFYLGY